MTSVSWRHIEPAGATNQSSRGDTATRTSGGDGGSTRPPAAASPRPTPATPTRPTPANSPAPPRAAAAKGSCSPCESPADSGPSKSSDHSCHRSPGLPSVAFRATRMARDSPGEQAMQQRAPAGVRRKTLLPHRGQGRQAEPRSLEINADTEELFGSTGTTLEHLLELLKPLLLTYLSISVPNVPIYS